MWASIFVASLSAVFRYRKELVKTIQRKITVGKLRNFSKHVLWFRSLNMSIKLNDLSEKFWTLTGKIIRCSFIRKRKPISSGSPLVHWSFYQLTIVSYARGFALQQEVIAKFTWKTLLTRFGWWKEFFNHPCSLLRLFLKVNYSHSLNPCIITEYKIGKTATSS